MPSKKTTTTTKKKKMSATVQAAVVTTIGAVVVALITGFITLNQKNDTPIVSPSSTPNPTATPIPPRPIFKETFDNNIAKWTVDTEMTDFNDSGYRTYKHIENGKYYRVVETNENYTGTYGSISIPKVIEPNFCLVFDARMTDTSENTSVIINARSNDFGTGKGSYYIIHLYSNGSGLVELAQNGTKQIGVLNNSIIWNDMQLHTVKISLQENELVIFDEQTGTQIQKIIIPDDGLILEAGEIRLGLEILKPNQKTTLEFDNIYVYDRCP